MKKILLAFEGTHFSNGVFEFARKMNQKAPSLVTGMFLPQIDFSSVWSYADGISGPLFIPMLERQESIEVQKNIEKFESLCNKHHISYCVHKDFTEFALPALKKETRFADLMILASESFYQNIGISEPNQSMIDAIHGSECPIVVVPEKFEFPESNLLTYDGSDDSVYAIKQFSYLFPELCKNNTLLVFAKHSEETHFPDEVYIEELAARHFPELTMHKLNIKRKELFNKWMAERHNSIVVSGSFGRSTISQMFRKSAITDVIRNHKLPVFIAHR